MMAAAAKLEHPSRDNKNIWRLPAPAIYVRCPGNGAHIVTRKPDGAACCHDLHVDERCKRPCRRHFRDCQASVDPTLPCSGPVNALCRVACDAPHMVPYWTGLQIVSIFLPPWFSAVKNDKFVAQQLGFRDVAEHRAPPAPARRPETSAELEVAAQRSRLRDAHRVPLKESDKKELHLGNVPWQINMGELLYGTLNKQAVGVAHLNIVQKMLMATVAANDKTECGDDATGQYPERNRLAATRFMRALNRLAVHHLTHRGFSIGYGDANLGNPRLDAQIALAIYGVKPPEVDESLPLAEKRKLDPIKYHPVRYDLAADDAKAVPIEVLERYKIPHDKQQLGVERASVQLIHDWVAKERKLARGETKGRDAGELGFSFVERRLRVEERIRSVCDRARDKAHEATIASMSQANGLWKCVSAGSKGSAENIGSIIACVGQQVSNSKRPCDHEQLSFEELDAKSSVETHKRWYSHVPRSIAYAAGVGGMVKRGYKDGCTPHDFFVEFYGGRDGLVDTAVRTAETGYMQRRITKTTESHRIAADGTVRNEIDQIISQWPGGYRIDPRFLMSTTCEPYAMPDRAFDKCALTLPDTSSVDSIFVSLCSDDSTAATDAAAREARRCRHMLAMFRSLPDYENSGGKLRVAGDISGIIADTMYQARCSDLFTYAQRGYAYPGAHAVDVEWKTALDATTRRRDYTPLTIEYAVGTLERWLTSTHVRRHDPVTLTHVMLILTAKQLLIRFQMPRELLNDVLARYERFLIFARAQNGDAFGIMCAQAFGEPLTQMTLRTFYTAGREAPVTRGVPRVAELISMRKTARTPMIEARFDYRRTFAEEARDRRFELLAARRNVLVAMYGDERLHVSLGAASTATPGERSARDTVHDILASVAQQIDSQYNWTLDAMFDSWIAGPLSSLNLDSLVARSSIGTLTGVVWGSSAKTVLVASVSNAFRAAFDADASLIADVDVRSLIAIVVSNIAAAVVPVVGVDARCVCVPLMSDFDQWYGVAFVVYCVAASRHASIYDDIRLKRADIAVLYPTVENLARAAKYAPDDASIASLANYLLQAMLDDAKRQVTDTPEPKDYVEENRTALNESILKTVRRTLPRTVLGDIIDSAKIEYVPMVRDDDGLLRQSTDVTDANDHECEAAHDFYDDAVCVNGCRRADCCENGRFNHSCPRVRCLGSFVLVLRLSHEWFNKTRYDPEALREFIVRYVGAEFLSVYIGDANSADYIPLYVRLHTCQLEQLAARTLNTSHTVVKHRQWFQSPDIVAMLDESMIGMSDADRLQQQQKIITDRLDASRQDTKSDAMFREMYVDLGYVASPDAALRDANLLVVALYREWLRTHARAKRMLRKFAALKLGDAQREVVALAKRELLAHRQWYDASCAFYDAIGPAPDPDSKPPAAPPMPSEFSDDASDVLLATTDDLYTLAERITTITSFIESYDASARPRLPNEFVAGVRQMLVDNGRRDPLGKRPPSLAPIDITPIDCEEQRDALRSEFEVRQLERVYKLLCSLYFCGTSSVVGIQTHLSREALFTSDNGLEFVDRVVVDIATTDYASTMSLRNIDKSRSCANNIVDVARALGIEAARATLIKQYTDVFQITGSHGISVHSNLAHVAGIQTMIGSCLPITRHGAKHVIRDTFQYASYEQAPIVLLNAAIARAEMPDVRSPSSAMCLALPTPGFGTGAIEIRTDVKALVKCEPKEVLSIEQIVAAFYSTASTMTPRALPLVTRNEAQQARSPFVSAADRAYDRAYTMPPTHAALGRDVDDLGIVPNGSFSSTRRATLAVDKSTTMRPPPSRAPRRSALVFDSTQGYDMSAPQTTWFARKPPPPTNDTDAYDPQRNFVVPIANRSSRDSYDPVDNYRAASASTQSERQADAGPTVYSKRRRTFDNVNY